MSEGNTTPSVEGALITTFAASHRLRSTFTSDHVIPLSLRGPLVIASSPLTSVVVRYFPETSDGIYAIALKDYLAILLLQPCEAVGVVHLTVRFNI